MAAHHPVPVEVALVNRRIDYRRDFPIRSYFGGLVVLGSAAGEPSHHFESGRLGETS